MLHLYLQYGYKRIPQLYTFKHFTKNLVKYKKFLPTVENHLFKETEAVILKTYVHPGYDNALVNCTHTPIPGYRGDSGWDVIYRNVTSVFTSWLHLNKVPCRAGQP